MNESALPIQRKAQAEEKQQQKRANGEQKKRSVRPLCRQMKTKRRTEQNERMKEPCFRCKRPTYFNDKVGPLKDGVLFHKGCFKCWICGSRLSLKSYHNNRNDNQDLEVYCAGHVPTPGPHDAIPFRSNLLWSPKTKGEYPHNLMRT
ncbi:hypothetical protein niasHT_011913 [Heterodera trifolii]|uniref:LIM zinc-binding domain-containing protein n=2 Tax=Heterodera TaxID=34509 RepID=A0ABD2KWK3_9BILA